MKILPVSQRPLVGRDDQLAALVSLATAKHSYRSAVELRGDAGTGKTRLLSTVAEQLSRQHAVPVVRLDLSLPLMNDPVTALVGLRNGLIASNGSLTTPLFDIAYTMYRLQTNPELVYEPRSPQTTRVVNGSLKLAQLLIDPATGLDLIAQVLTGTDAQLRKWWLTRGHGPLSALRLAEPRDVARGLPNLLGRDIGNWFADAMAEQAFFAEGDSSSVPTVPLVFLLDNAHALLSRAEHPPRWLRQMISHSPLGALWVFASRTPINTAVRDELDCTWSHDLRLRPMSRKEGALLLAESGVPDEDIDELLTLGGGSPLTLNILLDALQAKSDGLDETYFALNPVDRLLASLPVAQQALLRVCGCLESFTEGLLWELQTRLPEEHLDADSYSSLACLSFVREVGDDHCEVHELVRVQLSSLVPAHTAAVIRRVAFEYYDALSTASLASNDVDAAAATLVLAAPYAADSMDTGQTLSWICRLSSQSQLIPAPAARAVLDIAFMPLSHPSKEHAQSYADVLYWYADVVRTQGDFFAATPLLTELVELANDKELDMENAEDTFDSAVLYLARNFYDLGMVTTAMTIAETMLVANTHDGVLDTSKGETIALALSLLASCYLRTHQGEEALSCSRHALSGYRWGYPSSEPKVWYALDNLGCVYLDLSDYPRARSRITTALMRLESLLGPEHHEVATALSNLAQVALGQGELDEAEGLIRRAYRIRRNYFGPRHPQTIVALAKAGALRAAQGAHRRAFRLHRRAALAMIETQDAVTLDALIHWLDAIEQLLAMDETELAVAELLQARRHLSIKDEYFVYRNPQRTLARLFLRAGRFGDGVELLKNLNKRSKKEHDLEYQVSSALALADVLSAANKRKQAHSYLVQVRKAWAMLPSAVQSELSERRTALVQELDTR